MAYIIDTYNKYDAWDRTHARHIFTIHDVVYAIKEVQLEWGIPQIPTPIQYDIDPTIYEVFPSIQDALRYVQQIY